MAGTQIALLLFDLTWLRDDWLSKRGRHDRASNRVLGPPRGDRQVHAAAFTVRRRRDRFAILEAEIHCSNFHRVPIKNICRFEFGQPFERQRALGYLVMLSAAKRPASRCINSLRPVGWLSRAEIGLLPARVLL